MSVILEVVKLNFEYIDDDLLSFNKKLLNNISFCLSDGSSLHIKGKNGAGKTTMLKILAGLIKPNDGEIYYLEQLIYKNLAKYQQNICYVGHKTGISLALTVFENCSFDLKYQNQDIDILLEKFSLQEYKHTTCALLSAGIRRRVGLVRLLMSDAKVWLLDEPIIALDSDTVSNFIGHLQNHLHGGGIVVYSSHQQLNINSKSNHELEL